MGQGASNGRKDFNVDEPYVQDTALKWLEDHYQEKANSVAVAAVKEARIKKRSKRGYGRADGVLAWRLSDDSVLVASLEAKSSKAINELTKGYDDLRHFGHVLILGIVSLFVSGAVGWLAGVWLLKWVVPPAICLLVMAVFFSTTAKSEKYLLPWVIRQVLDYPGNERWIAISDEAYERIRDADTEALRRGCKRHAVGLIVVGENAGVVLLESPKFKPTPRRLKDFLQEYSKGDNIRSGLFLGVSF